MRTVVILAGPPGAGKTTLAHQSGMQVYDQDDPKWASVQHFNQALATLREHPAAKAVVIRSGATTSARRKAATTVGATHTYLVDPGQDVALHRVKARGRPAWRKELQGVLRWYRNHDRDDHAKHFPGWDNLGPPSKPPQPTRPAQYAGLTTTERGYGAAHRAERARLDPVVQAGQAVCTRCRQPIAAGAPWDLGHTDDRSAWTGPEHAACNRSAGGRNGNRVARERRLMVRRGWF